MASKYGIGSFLKSFVNFPAWMGASGLRRNARDISNMARDLFTVQSPPVRKETFQEAVTRLNLSASDLAQRQRAFARLAALYFAVFCCLGVYVAYLCYKQAWLSVIMTLVLMLVAAAFTFKEHFWYVQMRQQRLGLTAKDWFLFVIGKAKVGR